jgi:hypothetical protein
VASEGIVSSIDCGFLLLASAALIYRFQMYPTAGLPYARPLPQPPRLHWGFVLFFHIITLGYFESIWLIVQANWVRKVRGRSMPMVWAIVYASVFPIFIIAMIFVGVAAGLAGQTGSDLVEPLTLIFRLVIIVTRLTSVYTLRSELEESPINISTGGVMTLFFGSIYFQYFLHDFVLDPEDRPSADGTLGLSYR